MCVVEKPTKNVDSEIVGYELCYRTCVLRHTRKIRVKRCSIPSSTYLKNVEKGQGRGEGVARCEAE